jgi:hypothetical protein
MHSTFSLDRLHDLEVLFCGKVEETKAEENKEGMRTIWTTSPDMLAGGLHHVVH